MDSLIYIKNSKKYYNLLESNETLKKGYKLSYFLKNSHLQSFCEILLPKLPKIKYISEKIKITENDYIHIHWAPTPNIIEGTIIICPGITGSQYDNYIATIIDLLLENNYQCVVLTERYCDNKYAEKFTNWADDIDIEIVVKSLYEKIKIKRLFGIGFSGGANRLIKICSKLEKDNLFLFSGIFSISNPCDMKKNTKYIDNYQMIYSYLMTIYVSFILQKCKLCLISEYTDYISKTFCKYKNLDEYFDKLSCINDLENINTPLILLMSEDDHLICNNVISDIKNKCENNDNIILIITKYGGHMQFRENIDFFEVDKCKFKNNLILDFIKKMK